MQDFESAVASLTHTCGLVVEGECVHVRKSTNKYTTFFSQMFEPFLLGYWVTQYSTKTPVFQSAN